jgi:hypothetical protein
VSEKERRVMSLMGQKRTLTHFLAMSALPPKADIACGRLDVRFVPKAEVAVIGETVVLLRLTRQRCAQRAEASGRFAATANGAALTIARWR